MTVSTTTIKNSASGNGSNTTFAYSFKVFASSELKVVVRTNATGAESVRAEGSGSTNYSVTGVGNAAGGNVVFVTAPLSTETVVLYRASAKTQSFDLVENDPFLAESFEESLDKITHQNQEMQEEIDRTLKLSSTNTMTSTEFTQGSTDRASKVLSFDSSGELSVAQELGTFRGNWAASTAYVLRDLVKDTTNNNIYICITAHTSSGANLSANDSARWSLIVDAASASTSQSAAASSASAAATSATAAASSATAASSSASTASTQASNASNSASTASTQASNASTSASNSEASAGALAFKYTFDNSTSIADPGSNGEWRWNNATVGSVNSLAIRAATADTGNPDISPYIITWDDSTSTVNGHVLFRKSGTPATFAIFAIGAITDNGDWLQIALTHVASNGTWSNADTGYISFIGRNGDKGDTGAQGSQGIQGATGATGPVAEAFKTIAVSGQSSVVADAAEDTLTLVGGDNITVTTNAGTDTVTITGAAGGAGYFLGNSSGATGDTTNGLTDIFRVNNNALATSCTIAANTNASCAGPLSVSSSVTVTVNGTLVII